MISAWGFDRPFSLRNGDIQVDFFGLDCRPHECIPGYQLVVIGNCHEAPVNEIMRVTADFGIPLTFGSIDAAIEYLGVT
jgi:hypothetical protein